MPRDDLSWRGHVVPAPDLEPCGQYKYEDRQNDQRLKIFDGCYQVYINTRMKRHPLADEDFGFTC
jgi:hypothetical protein